MVSANTDLTVHFLSHSRYFFLNRTSDGYQRNSVHSLHNFLTPDDGGEAAREA